MKPSKGKKKGTGVERQDEEDERKEARSWTMPGGDLQGTLLKPHRVRLWTALCLPAPYVELELSACPQPLGLQASQNGGNWAFTCSGPGMPGTQQSLKLPPVNGHLHLLHNRSPHPEADRHSQSWVGDSSFHPRSDSKGSQRD